MGAAFPANAKLDTAHAHQATPSLLLPTAHSPCHSGAVLMPERLGILSEKEVTSVILAVFLAS